MTSSTVQLGTVQPGWLTVPSQVPPKAARPEDAAAADVLGTGGVVAGGCRADDGPGRPGVVEAAGAPGADAAGWVAARDTVAAGLRTAGACPRRCAAPAPGRAGPGSRAMPTDATATSTTTPAVQPSTAFLGRRGRA